MDYIKSEDIELKGANDSNLNWSISSGPYALPPFNFTDKWKKQKAPSNIELLTAYQGTVFGCVQLNTQEVYSANLRLYTKTSKRTSLKLATRKLSYHRKRKLFRGNTNNIEEVLEHPFLDSINYPNTDQSREEFIGYSQAYQEIIGSSYWQKIRQGNRVVGYITLPSQYVVPIKDLKTNRVGVYHYGWQGQMIELDPSEVVAINFFNPIDPFINRGYSPLRAAWQQLNIEQKFEATIAALLDNEGRPSGILSAKDGLGRDEAIRWEQKFNQKFRQAGTGNVMVLEEDSTFTPLNWAPKDLGALEVTDKAKLIICACFGVPPVLLDQQATNYGTLDAATAQHIQKSINPRLKNMEGALNKLIREDFDPTGNLFVRFDNPSPEDKEAKKNEYVGYVQAGIMTRNEVRYELDLPPHPDGDILVSANQPGGFMGEDSTDDVEEPTESETATLAPEDITFALGLVTQRNSGEITDDTLIFILTATGKWTKEQIAEFIESLPEEPKEEQDVTSEDSEDKPVEEPIEEPIEEVPTEDKPKDGESGIDSENSKGKASRLETKKASKKKKKRIPAGKPPADTKLQGILKRFFEKQHKTVIRELTKGFEQNAITKALPTEFHPVDQWSDDLADESMPIIELIMQDSGKGFLTRCGASPDAFNVFNEKVADNAKKLSLAFAESTNKATSARLNDALDSLRHGLAEGLTDGERLSAYTDRVNEIFDGLSKDWSEVIARTEVSRSHEMGSKDAAKASGVVSKMYWLLAPDPCIECETLAADFADGVPIDGDFGVRDTNNDAYANVETPPLHPNCFCSVIYETDQVEGEDEET